MGSKQIQESRNRKIIIIKSLNIRVQQEIKRPKYFCTDIQTRYSYARIRKNIFFSQKNHVSEILKINKFVWCNNNSSARPAVIFN